MTNRKKPYRTVFVGELVQKTGLSTGGRDGDLYADAIMARDGQGRPLLRGSGLAGTLLAVLDDFDLEVPGRISRGVSIGTRDEGSAESLWLLHHAHLISKSAAPAVRPNVAIHPWTGAAADRQYFSTEVLPRGTRWRIMIETDDWREQSNSETSSRSAKSFLALALREWVEGRCWLGRSPARGLGWAQLEAIQVFSLDSRAASYWPNAKGDDESNIALLKEKAKNSDNGVTRYDDFAFLLDGWNPNRYRSWRFYKGCLRVGESEDEDHYGLDSLSTLARDFPSNPETIEGWFSEPVQVEDAKVEPHKIEPDAVPAWSLHPEGEHEFLVPGSAIRGALRSAVSAWWRRAGENVWAPNGNYGAEPQRAADDPLLPLFGSIQHDSNLLISDAWQEGEAPKLYLLEQHAEDEFAQGVYGSEKFNRPCLISGQFGFRLALRVRELETREHSPEHKESREHHEAHVGLAGELLNQAEQALALAGSLGSNRFLPIGGGVWRGHGWIKLEITPMKPSTSIYQPHRTTDDREKGA